jgi:hypothetical protein
MLQGLDSGRVTVFVKTAWNLSLMQPAVDERIKGKKQGEQHGLSRSCGLQVMEALPRSALVEVQPLACIGQSLVADTPDTDSDDGDHDSTASAANERTSGCLDATKGNLSNRASRVEIGAGKNPSRVHIHALASMGRFCRVHVDFLPGSGGKLIGSQADSGEMSCGASAAREGGGTAGMTHGGSRESPCEDEGGVVAGAEGGEGGEGSVMSGQGEGRSALGLEGGGETRESGEGSCMDGGELVSAVEAAKDGVTQALREAGLGLGDVVEVAVFYCVGLVRHGVMDGMFGAWPAAAGHPLACIPVLAVGSDSTAAAAFQLQVTAARL